VEVCERAGIGLGNCGFGIAAGADVVFGVATSTGSDEGGSLEFWGVSRFNGVRKGDLKGLWSVFDASFSRRRFACGVSMFSANCALRRSCLSVLRRAMCGHLGDVCAGV
jgi:hypothetical protein